ncbi:MAG: hypothetical protein H5U20_07675 [Rhodobacteraceae bacterium]|nr:hypothetical protein [Paracoccaceae bacterium]MBC7157379.1 hypothetical protein [Paracoccaceae bacterium]
MNKAARVSVAPPEAAVRAALDFVRGAPPPCPAVAAALAQVPDGMEWVAVAGGLTAKSGPWRWHVWLTGPHLSITRRRMAPVEVLALELTLPDDLRVDL